MMPLWTMATPSWTWGWALASEGRPARVADAGAAVEGFAGDERFEVFELALAAQHVEGAVFEHRHAGRVVAAIFEALETADEHRDGVLRADVTDDSAHGERLLGEGPEAKGRGPSGIDPRVSTRFLGGDSSQASVAAEWSEDATRTKGPRAAAKGRDDRPKAARLRTQRFVSAP